MLLIVDHEWSLCKIFLLYEKDIIYPCSTKYLYKTTLVINLWYILASKEKFFFFGEKAFLKKKNSFFFFFSVFNCNFENYPQKNLLSFDSHKKSFIFQIGTMITEVTVIRATSMVFAAVKVVSMRVWMELMERA